MIDNFNVENSVHPFQLFLVKRPSSLNTDEYNRIRDMLFNGCFEYKAHYKEISELIDIRVNFFNEIPKVPSFQFKKLERVSFDEIPVKDSDSNEIKKFLRKSNYDFIGFHCNHNVYDEQYELMRSKFMKLIDSESFQSYSAFISSVINDIVKLIQLDITSHNESLKAKFVVNKILTVGLSAFESNFKIAKANTIRLCSELLEINSKSHPSCSKCESKKRLYQYVLKEVERMRGERKSQQIESEEATCDITSFMNRQFKNVDEVKICDIIKLWKCCYNISINKDELVERIKDTMQWRIVSHSRQLIAKRL